MLGVNKIEVSSAELRRFVSECEAQVAVLRAEQAVALAELDQRQAPLAGGCKSMQEWVAGRLDVAPETAARLVGLSRLDPGSDTWRDLVDGEITVDRALAEARLGRCDVDRSLVRQSRDWDIPGVRRLASLHRRTTPADERAAFESRYFQAQPNLDESVWDLRGRLAGMDGKIVSSVVDAIADRLPSDGGSVGQRRADALVAIAEGAVHAPPDGGEPLPVVATVFVDAALAGETGGEAGVEVVGGPRVGPLALEEILCGGKVEVDVDGAVPLGVGPAAHGIPPRLRRFVLARDGGVCSVGGCTSRYRLQVHHVLPVSQGGTNDPHGLGAFCWYHHIVVIHRRGFRVDPGSPPQARRLIPP